MKRIFIFSVKLLLCLFVGCSAIPTSTEQNSTLLVGEIVFIGSDYISNNGISFSGTITSGIDITLRNTTTNELSRFSSDKNGLFYMNLKEGKYLIDELYIKREDNRGAWAYLYTNPPQKILEIEEGKVNNIGTIRWSFVDRKHDVLQTDNSFAVKMAFSKQFSKSNWNQKEWKYNPLSSNVIKSSDENVTYYLKSEGGQDSTRITIPQNMPEDIKKQIETDVLKRMNDIRLQGDTTYYIKSENGLDSVFIKIPKGLPEESKRRMEEHVKQQMNTNHLQREK
jgi:hypothetical protein